MTPEMLAIIAEAKRLDGLATEGPWERWYESICAHLTRLENGKVSAHWLFDIDLDNQEDQDEEGESETADTNTHFVCFSRTALPALVAEVERLQRVVDQAVGFQRMEIGEGMDGNPCARSFGLGLLRDISHCPELYAELKAREK